jgi:quercetin dioxygenase-like cupin family protein
MSRIYKPFLLLATGAALGGGAVAIAGTAEQPTRNALAASTKVAGAKGRTLALSEVIIPAKSQLPLHHHTGTQVAYIDAGTLSYTVKSGSVTVYKGAADGTQKVVRKIKAGQTALIKQHQWLVEQPNVVHRAANNGNGYIQIHLATLLPNGDPPSVPNK